MPLTASVLPTEAFNKEVAWSSSDPKIATIDSSGVVTGINSGDVIITATASNGVTGSITISVLKHVTGVTIVPNNIAIKNGNTLQLKYEIHPSDASNKNVTWSSSSPNVCHVSDKGLLTAIGHGKAIITCTTNDGNFSATCTVTVEQPVSSIELSKKEISLIVGQTASLTVTILPLEANNKDLNWTSSDSSVAYVDKNGRITAINGGVATITATSVDNPEIKDECIVTVIQPVTNVTLNKTALELVEDTSEQLVATIEPENATTKDVNWTSSDNSIAIVSPDGTVYALKSGQATIMVTTIDGGFAALCKITVRAKTIPAESLYMSINTANMTVNETLQLKTVILPDNTSNKTISWSSTNSNVASVDKNGLVYAKKDGETQIIATTTDGSNLSAICNITVLNQLIQVTSISIDPSSATILTGDTMLLIAQISPKDATTQDINWSSTNNSIASVTSDGTITGHKAGQATIIATTTDGSNLSATCNVEVSDQTGISNTLIDNDSNVQVYTMTGLLIYDGVYSKADLTPGIYIFVTNGQKIKYIIR